MVLLTKKSALITLVVVFACTLCQVGCVPTITKLKSGILRTDKTDKSSAQAKSPESGKEAAEKPADTPRSPVAARQGEAAASSSRAPTTDATEPPEESGRQTPARKEDRRSASDSSKEKPSPESDDDAERLTGGEEPPKRHDHAGYVAMIKNQATELLNKDRACTYARICRKSLTDEWLLTMFYREDKVFRFVIFGWDQVDEKWKKSYTSERLPIARWEQHVKFTAAGKECTDIKKPGR